MLIQFEERRDKGFAELRAMLSIIEPKAEPQALKYINIEKEESKIKLTSSNGKILCILNVDVPMFGKKIESGMYEVVTNTSAKILLGLVNTGLVYPDYRALFPEENQYTKATKKEGFDWDTTTLFLQHIQILHRPNLIPKNVMFETISYNKTNDRIPIRLTNEVFEFYFMPASLGRAMEYIDILEPKIVQKEENKSCETKE